MEKQLEGKISVKKYLLEVLSSTDSKIPEIITALMLICTGGASILGIWKPEQLSCRGAALCLISSIFLIVGAIQIWAVFKGSRKFRIYTTVGCTGLFYYLTFKSTTNLDLALWGAIALASLWTWRSNTAVCK